MLAGQCGKSLRWSPISRSLRPPGDWATVISSFGGAKASWPMVVSRSMWAPSEWVPSVMGDSDVKSYHEKRVVPFDANTVYDVVSDVEQYCKFVPYTVESRILEKVGPGEAVAELCVGFSALNERYKSRVRCDSKNLTVVAEAEGSDMFNVMKNTWQFEERPLDPKTCLLKFSLDFQFRSSLYNAVAETYFVAISNKMVDAFLERCKDVKATRVSDPKDVPVSVTRLEDETEVLLCELETLSHFSLGELDRIKRDFDNTTRKGKNTISGETFSRLFVDMFKDGGYSIQDLTRCSQIVFQALDLNRDNELSLREWTAGLSTVLKGTSAERSRFWLRCYNLELDGFVSRSELYEMIHASMSIRDALLQAGIANRVGGKAKTFRIASDINVLANKAVDTCFEDCMESDNIPVKLLLEKKIL
mmetsp:Transcript_19456/g.32013  ORF Transcript_19456/g.32013 Transcript_19456/m.32013 type:complete len:418 (+) Transcript_19456:1669-2922(+)